MSRRVNGRRRRCRRLVNTHTKPLAHTDRHTLVVTHTFLSVSHTHSVQRGGGSPSKVSPPPPPAGGSLLCCPSSLHPHRSDRPGFTSCARRPASGGRHLLLHPTCCGGPACRGRACRGRACGRPHLLPGSVHSFQKSEASAPSPPPCSSPFHPPLPHIIGPSVAPPTRSDRRCSHSVYGLCRSGRGHGNGSCL